MAEELTIPGTGTDNVEEQPQTVFGSAAEFLDAVLIPLYHRKVSKQGQARWSSEWWRSAEAITRIDAMWRAWEYLRNDPATGMSVWLKDHADYHMGVLLSTSGPFATSHDENAAGEPLPVASPPAAMFPDHREEQDDDR